VDLQLYLRVIWRFKLLVAFGLLLAVGLSFLAIVRVSLDPVGFSYRQPEQWTSEGTVLVSQRGFPWGRSITELFTFSVDEATGREFSEPRFGSPDRFSDLAALYAELAVSDPVREIMLRDGPIEGSFAAEAVESSQGDGLPLVSVFASASSPAAASRTAERGVQAFLDFLAREQTRNRIAPEDRVVVSVVERPQEAVLVAPRKLTRPIVIFLTVLIAVIGLAFVLENLRPRVRPVASEAAERMRRSA
jgi:hypothetical protein